LAWVDDPQAAADRLVELATRGERGDNVTALVVDRLGDRP
jgi:serine/threonine protein phosphatase PrpC